MMDESNDKADKSSIILVRTLDPVIDDIGTNISTAVQCTEVPLAKYDLDFSEAVAFM